MNATAYVTTRKVGGSLVVTLPKEVVDLLNIHEKETIKMVVVKVAPDFFGSCKGIGTSIEVD